MAKPSPPLTSQADRGTQTAAIALPFVIGGGIILTRIGYFSSDQGATSEAANAYQLGKLREAEQPLQQQTIAKFGGPLSKEALANGLDLYNQAPQAALDAVGGYVDRLPSANPAD